MHSATRQIRVVARRTQWLHVDAQHKHTYTIHADSLQTRNMPSNRPAASQAVPTQPACCPAPLSVRTPHAG